MITRFEIDKLPEFDNHELVVFFSDKKTKLRGFIAIHNTHLGPATGGTRFARYKSDSDALRDALKLSRAMTYKCSLAGVPYGGSKVVIMAGPGIKKNEKFLKTYARVVDSFNGGLHTGEDVGMTERDLEILSKNSKNITGNLRGVGDLSPLAALGVFSAMQAALMATFGNADMSRRTFAIKGLGKVGGELCRLIYQQGGNIIGADVNKETVRRVKKNFPRVKIVDPATIHRVAADVFSPCALGGDLNTKTIPQIKAKIICGAANNQLATPADGERIYRRGILYIPDYLANAGGLIGVVDDCEPGGFKKNRVLRRVRNIRKTAHQVITLAQRKRLPTHIVANRIAEEKFVV